MSRGLVVCPARPPETSLGSLSNELLYTWSFCFVLVNIVELIPFIRFLLVSLLVH